MTTAAPQPSRPEHELKLVTPVGRAEIILDWLRARCRPDPAHPDGLVTSIYFDNRDVDLLRDKVNSNFIKRKVRVRWYTDPDTGAVEDPAFVELKRKLGARRFKAREPVRGQSDVLASSRPSLARLRTMLGALRQAGHLLETDLQPFLRIGFRRRRFVDPTTGSRVSIDSGIRAASVNPGLLPYSHPAPLAHAVIEVKGALSSLPRWLAPLRDLGCHPESFSKYARCYQKLARRSSF